MQIPELLAQRKFDSAMCHAHLNAHKLQSILNMSADISETIKDRELFFFRFRFRGLVAAQVCYANMPRPL